MNDRVVNFAAGPGHPPVVRPGAGPARPGVAAGDRRFPARGVAPQPLVRGRDRRGRGQPPIPARDPGLAPRRVLPGRGIHAVLDGADESPPGRRPRRRVRGHRIVERQGGEGSGEGGLGPRRVVRRRRRVRPDPSGRRAHGRDHGGRRLPPHHIERDDPRCRVPDHAHRAPERAVGLRFVVRLPVAAGGHRRSRAPVRRRAEERRSRRGHRRDRPRRPARPYPGRVADRPGLPHVRANTARCTTRHRCSRSTC